MTTNPLVRTDYTLLVPKRVHYHEVDIQNVAFNANYLVYADIAVTEYFRALSQDDGREAMDYFGSEGDIMVRHTEIDFRAPAKADDMLDMGTRVRKFGNSSFVLEVAMFRGEELLTVVTTTYVHFIKATGRPAPLPDHFRKRVTEFETVKPQ